MTITSINYKRTYNLGNYSSESIGLDADLELGENPETAMASLKKQVEELHRQNNPQLWENTPIPTKFPEGYVYDKSKESFTLTKAEEQSEPKSLAQQIKTCTDLKVLESYKLLIQKDEQAKAAYLEMLEKLSPESQSI